MTGTKKRKSKSNIPYDRFFRSIYRIRRVEEEIARIYPTDKIKSPVHLSIGQEGVAVGVCEALRPGDVVFGTYRGHALYLAKGGDLKEMTAELYGKVTGCTRGKGGSMHLIAPLAGMMGTSAVVGTTIPQAVGYAYALHLRGSDSLVVSFFGEGATEEGVFHESLNFASVKRLPMIFVCENNLYAIHSHYLARQPKDNLCERVRTYGIPAKRIANNDVIQIWKSIKKAGSEIRAGKSGPQFLECMTYRFREHVGPGEDWHLGYRSKTEGARWIKNDPLKRLGEFLDESRRRKIERKIDLDIREAFDFADRSDFPANAELTADVFKES